MIKTILFILIVLLLLFITLSIIVCETVRKKMLEQNFTEQEMYQIITDPKYKDDLIGSIVKYHLVVMRLKKKFMH